MVRLRLWFVLQHGVALNVVLFSVLVLTVVRAVPVGLTTLRSSLTKSERILLAGLGPRGTASIVLALLAYIVLPDVPDQTLLSVAILVVIGSVVIHGVLGPWLVGRSAANRAVPQRQ